MLQLLSIKQDKLNGKSYIEEISNDIVNKETFKKYIDVFNDFKTKLEEKLKDAGKTLKDLDTFNKEDNEAFKIAARLLREPSGKSTGRSSLNYS